MKASCQVKEGEGMKVFLKKGFEYKMRGTRVRCGAQRSNERDH
jgi:hypothetical protein